MGFERGGGQMLGFSIDSRRRPYNTLALPCQCVIGPVVLPLWVVENRLPHYLAIGLYNRDEYR